MADSWSKYPNGITGCRPTFFYFPNKIEEKERTKRRLKEQSDGTGSYRWGRDRPGSHLRPLSHLHQAINIYLYKYVIT